MLRSEHFVGEREGAKNEQNEMGVDMMRNSSITAVGCARRAEECLVVYAKDALNGTHKTRNFIGPCLVVVT